MKSAPTTPTAVEISPENLDAMNVNAICSRILDVIFELHLHKFDDTMEKLELGKPKFLSVIGNFVTRNKEIEMCLPAFPFKSSNKVYKVLGTLPDKAEELALDRLNDMCIRIAHIYPPGACLTIISDGLVYNGMGPCQIKQSEHADNDLNRSSQRV